MEEIAAVTADSGEFVIISTAVVLDATDCNQHGLLIVTAVDSYKNAFWLNSHSTSIHAPKLFRSALFDCMLEHLRHLLQGWRSSSHRTKYFEQNLALFWQRELRLRHCLSRSGGSSFGLCQQNFGSGLRKLALHECCRYTKTIPQIERITAANAIPNIHTTSNAHWSLTQYQISNVHWPNILVQY